MKTFYKRLLFAFFFVALIGAVRFSGLGSYINLAYIRANNEYFYLMVNHYYGFAVMLFCALYALIVLCSLPVTAVLNIAGGYFFGVIFGTLYSVIGATIGATLSFFMFRYLLRNGVQKRYGDKLATFNQEFKKRGVSYLLFLQLLPITPFGFITIISGLSPISWVTFVWTTMVGMLPGAFLYAVAGKQLMTICQPSDILSWPLMSALLALAGFSLLPIVVKGIHDKKIFCSH